MSEWELRMMAEKHLGPKHYNVSDLIELGRDNPVVYAHWQAWVSGYAGSFEQMLIHLAIDLAKQNEQLMGVAVKQKRMEFKRLDLPDTPEIREAHDRIWKATEDLRAKWDSIKVALGPSPEGCEWDFELSAHRDQNGKCVTELKPYIRKHGEPRRHGRIDL